VGSRVEVITGVERRRRWSVAEKLRLVEEASRPGTSVSAVARRRGVCRSLLFTWRRQHREGALVRSDGDPCFVPVAFAANPPGRSSAADVVERPLGLIEVELPNGCRLRVDRGVDPRALRRVVVALTGR
jgi:transposase